MAAVLRGLSNPDENKDGGSLDGNLALIWEKKIDGFFDPAREKRLEHGWMDRRTNDGRFKSYVLRTADGIFSRTTNCRFEEVETGGEFC